MLRKVSLALAQEGDVTVIARRQRRLEALQEEVVGVEGRIHPVALNYHHTDILVKSLETAIEKRGPFSLAVFWIHRTAPEAPEAAARLLGSPDTSCRLFHILGSAVNDPSHVHRKQRESLAFLPHVRYREVRLGFIREVRGSRWLTREEISDGVLEAIRRDSIRHIIGQLDSWDARPEP